jgi:murein L,D-transpeptidase YafK
VGSIVVAMAATLGAAEAASPASEGTAAERLERWRASRSGRLSLPLPGTPDTDKPLTRLAAAGVALGTPMMIRIFKAESELEVWVRKGRVYVPFATYPVCYWSGTLGPKLREGDKQTPEGFYAIAERHLHHGGRWRRSLNIGFPNAFDHANGRSGSVILVHGGCDSIGCFAMTDAVNAELYDLVSAALRNGAAAVPLHVFPFRLTDANLAAHPAGRWKDFWDDLKQGYDSFERTRLPPDVSVCGKRYRVRDNSPFVRNADGVELCGQDRDMVPAHLELDRARQPTQARVDGKSLDGKSLDGKSVDGPSVDRPAPTQARMGRPAPRCATSRASCRKWVALRDRRAASRTVAEHRPNKKAPRLR